MPSITIKDIPDELLVRLRQRAASDRRSLNREVVHLLDRALSGAVAESGEAEVTRRVEAQVQAWRQLAGRWESVEEADREVERIYAARTAGRRVSL